MRTFLFVAATACLIITLRPSLSDACGCGGGTEPVADPVEQFRSLVVHFDDPIVIGKVRRQIKHSYLMASGIELSVARVLRGAKRRTVVVWTPVDSCGPDPAQFTVGSRWALVLHPAPHEGGIEYALDECVLTWLRVGADAGAVSERAVEKMVRDGGTPQG